MKRSRKIFPIVAIVFCIGLGLGGAANRGLILYHPDTWLPSPTEAGAPDMRPVQIMTKDGLKLTSWFDPPDDPDKPVLLFFMGDTGSFANYASEFVPFTEKGYGLFLLGYRGFGGNPGEPSEKGLYNDARAAVDWLQGKGYDLRRIVFYGHSLGTGIAVEMAIEYPAQAVVLEAPYTTLPDTVQMNLPMVKSNWFMKDRYDNIAKIAKIKIPLLIIQGTKDEVIPVAQGKALFKAALGPKLSHFIPGGGHSNLFDYGSTKLVMDFLENPPADPDSEKNKK
jgi:fermentation-respiration switch protein FrsA (DUF1100 family)